MDPPMRNESRCIPVHIDRNRPVKSYQTTTQVRKGVSRRLQKPPSHLANGPWNKSLNFIFPTKYVIPKRLSRLAIGQVSHFSGGPRSG